MTSPGTWWSFEAARPTAALTGLALGYGGFQEVGPPVLRLEAAKPRLTLVLGFAERLAIGSATDAPRLHLNAFVTGLGGPLRVGHDGRQACVEVELAPWAAGPVFGVAPDELSGVVPLDQLWGAGATELLEVLADTRDRDHVPASTSGINRSPFRSDQ